MKKYLLVLPIILLSSCGRDEDKSCQCRKKIYERYIRKDIDGFPVETPEWTLVSDLTYSECLTPTNGMKKSKNDEYTGTDNNNISRYKQFSEEITCK